MKIDLVPDWRQAWRWASTRSMAGVMALLGTYAAMPDDVKAALPPNLVMYVAIIWLVAGIFGRLVKQKGKKDDKSGDVKMDHSDSRSCDDSVGKHHAKRHDVGSKAVKAKRPPRSGIPSKRR